MSQKIQNIWNVGCRPEWTSLSGSPLDFALPLYKCVKLTRLLIQSTHQSWMRHHHDSGFSLAGTQKMSHCRISHQTGHQPHSRATLKPRGQIHQAMGDLKHQLGDCALPLQNQQKKGARKCIHHLITFLVLLFEYCCSCAQGVIHQRGPESTSRSLPATSHWLHRMRSENRQRLQKTTSRK